MEHSIYPTPLRSTSHIDTEKTGGSPRNQKESSPRNVITYGTFDLFHVGHLNLLKRARSLGDELFVGVSIDNFNREKGKDAIIPYPERLQIISSLSCVTHTFPEISIRQKKEDIKKYNIDILVMGDDWEGKFDFLSSVGIRVEYLPRTKGISTTQIKEKIIAGCR